MIIDIVQTFIFSAAIACSLVNIGMGIFPPPSIKRLAMWVYVYRISGYGMSIFIPLTIFLGIINALLR